MARIVVAALDADVRVEVDGVTLTLERSHSREFSFRRALVIHADKAGRSDANVSGPNLSDSDVSDPDVSDPMAGTGAFRQSSGD